MTPEHERAADTYTDVAEGRGWRHREMQEILTLVRSLVSGDIDTLDTRTHKAVPIEELEEMLSEAKSRDEDCDIFRDNVAATVRGWLSGRRWLSTPDATEKP
jgi:hypothetical protein